MTPRSRPVVGPASGRLRQRRRGDRIELWTEAVGAPPAVYGERWREFEGRPFRSFEPTRSKLAAGLVLGWEGPVPGPSERWLYLGAASGTTTSHVADLVGPSGRVYAVEKSLRPFARLLRLAQRWPNVWPVLEDARAPVDYFDLVPEVDGIYADVAQPDQVEIVERNAALYLRRSGAPVLVALKTASMGRDRPPAAFVSRAENALERSLDLVPTVRLEPFHRGHYLVGGVARASLFRGDAPGPVTPRRARRPGR